MALHGNDPSRFSRGDGCTSDKNSLKDPESMFRSVEVSHMTGYPITNYTHNAELFLKNLSHCTGRPEFSVAPPYHGEESHMENSDLSLDFGHRSGIYRQGHHSYSPDNPGHDLYSERCQASSGHVVRTRRRKAGGLEEARVCVVCSEPASGYNFDRLTCESCKAFFRRNALKPKEKVTNFVKLNKCPSRNRFSVQLFLGYTITGIIMYNLVLR